MCKLLLVAFVPIEISQSLGFAAALGLPYDVLCLTGQPSAENGAHRTIISNLEEIPHADGLAHALIPLIHGYTHIAGVSSMRAKDLLARLAGLIEAAMVTDAIAVESPTKFKRPIVAGAIIATIEALTEPIVLTFRPSGFPKILEGHPSSLEHVRLDVTSSVKSVGRTARTSSRPDLSQAKVVVSGGRPLKDAETFEKVIGGLADALGGAVGATRAAVDNGIAPNELQVGQTGKIVAPDLYIAAGISGSTQHMAGIKDSKLIVAINKDPDAPIFDFADLGIVADLYDVIPELRARLARQG